MLISQMTPVELFLASLATLPIIGAVLIYLGFRRARNETTRLKDPTKWDYFNQGAGYWIIGGLIVGSWIFQVFSRLFS